MRAAILVFFTAQRAHLEARTLRRRGGVRAVATGRGTCGACSMTRRGAMRPLDCRKRSDELSVSLLNLASTI